MQVPVLALTLLSEAVLTPSEATLTAREAVLTASGVANVVSCGCTSGAAWADTEINANRINFILFVLRSTP